MRLKKDGLINRTNATKVMALIVLVCVYASVYIVLPDVTQVLVNGNRNIFSESEESNQSEESKRNGESNQSVQDKRNSTDLKDKVIVIDSGHGGVDPGKESSDGIKEKDINLKIAFLLKEKLESKNAKIVMTRTDDSGLYSETDSNKKVSDMKKRCAIIKECNADLVISIHQNSYQTPSIKGAQMFYYKHSVEGKKFANLLQNAVKEELDPDNKRVEKADSTYYMLIHSSAPTVIAECGFLSNSEEASLLRTDEYQEKVATALLNGILDYFGN